MNRIEAQIAHLEFLKSLIPGEEDIIRYSLDEEEMIDACRLFGYLSPDIIAPYLQLVCTVLRKRRAENPRKLLKIRDLSDFIAILLEDRGNIVSNDLLFQMKKMGAIKVDLRKRVSIKI